jgi:hypothetical protein
MKRFAAHYIFLAPDTRLKMHYVELSDDNKLMGIYPLDKEIAQTAFYNGTLIIKQREDKSQSVEVYHLDSLELPSAELCTNDSSSNSYIQRLC